MRARARGGRRFVSAHADGGSDPHSVSAEELKDSWALHAPFDVGEGGRIGCVVVEAPIPDTRRTSSSVAI